MPVVAARIAIPSNKPALDTALEGLVKLNVQLLRQHAAAGHPVPELYAAGVHWQPDREKGRVVETWDTIDVVRKRGYGDCEDLAAWRAAELRWRQGVPARAVVRRSNTPGVAWHAVVELPDGKILDPSVRLGMRQWQAAHRPPVAGDGVQGVPGRARAQAQKRARRAAAGRRATGDELALVGGEVVGRDFVRALRGIAAWAGKTADKLAKGNV